MNLPDMAAAFPVSLLEGFGTGEVLLILVASLLLFGSKSLPSIARNLGKALEEFRRAARDVSDEILHADEPSPPKRKGPDAAPPKGAEDSKNEPDH